MFRHDVASVFDRDDQNSPQLGIARRERWTWEGGGKAQSRGGCVRRPSAISEEKGREREREREREGERERERA